MERAIREVKQAAQQGDYAIGVIVKDFMRAEYIKLFHNK